MQQISDYIESLRLKMSQFVDGIGRIRHSKFNQNPFFQRIQSTRSILIRAGYFLRSISHSGKRTVLEVKPFFQSSHFVVSFLAK